MRPRLSLRARFVVALLAVVTVLSAAFGYSVHLILEWVESELETRALDRELADVSALLARHAAPVLPARSGVRVYVIDGEAALAALPERLRSLRPGHHRELLLDGRRHQAARRDLGTRRVIVARDVEQVEALERRLSILAWMVIGGGLLAATVAGLLLGRAVMRPVERLAATVTALDPARRGLRVDAPSGDPQIGRIAAAFDQFLERLDRYVAREKAFTDQASHELRTPLAIIDSAAQLLRRQIGPGDAATPLLARIERSTAQMHRLIEALLLLARADGGPAPEAIALDALLEEACEQHRALLGGRDLDLVCRIATPQTVRAPRGMVLCVVNNLLGNAIRHSVRGRVEVRLEAGCLVVHDSGPGVRAQDAPHIFELGYRGGDSRGSGLGLHLVRRVCERLGWDIALHPAPGGACFRVCFEAAASA